MKILTIEEFFKLPKKAPISGRSLEPGKLYYIYDARDKTNPVHIGTYVKPVTYYNDNSVSYNYKFEDVKYLANPSKYRREPSNIFGNIDKYYEVLYPTPTKLDIKNKKDTLTELSDFIRVKKAEPHDSTPTISFMGKDYRKVRDKYNNMSTRQRSSLLSSKKHTKRRSSSRSSTSSKSSRKMRSSRSSSRPSSHRSYNSSNGSY